MIVGLGIDTVNIERFGRQLERTPALAERLFSPQERDGKTIRSLAARFAAKEALAKALGAPGTLRWHDAEVVGGQGSAPRLELRGSCAERAADLGVTRWHLSLTHDEPVAQAIVILESD